MNVEFYIGEKSRGKEYSGSFKKDHDEVEWVLVFHTPLSGMDEEIESRIGAGQELNSKKVRDELFRLSFTRNGSVIVLPENYHCAILQYLVERAISFHAAPVSGFWGQLTKGTCPSPFIVSETIVVKTAFARCLFTVNKKKGASTKNKKK